MKSLSNFYLYFRLLPLISTLTDHIKYKKESLEVALSRMSKRDNKKTLSFIGHKRNLEQDFKQSKL